MRNLFIILLFPVFSFSQTLTIQSPVRFLALGDSYTIGESVPSNQRWPVQLIDSLALRGINIDTSRIIATTGWRTDDLISAITNKNLQAQQYNLVSLLIGVNNQYQGSPFSQYVNEFPQLLDSAIRYAGGDTGHVFVISIPDYAYTPYGVQSMNQAQISQEIDQYNAMNKLIADSFHIRYFDITPISRTGLTQPALVAGDGLHPSGLQYTEWVKLMLDYLDSDILTKNSDLYADQLLELSPNPVNGALRITGSNQMKEIEILSMVGGLTTKFSGISKAETISMEDFPPGIYFVKAILSNGAIVTRKFIKQ
ncbi:MAG: hypothetical protein K0S26_2009 [Bacteroidota bacterium]|jgi:lysophospholipase L1-like esterase|nr:hypothetical protein [Bacteroidota bacterium]